MASNRGENLMQAISRRLRLAAALAAIAATTGLAAATFGAAPAAAVDGPLSLPAYGDLAVDPDHRRVYVSGGPASNGIVVTDLSGRVQTTITGQYGATGLVLSADKKTLYAALASGDAISVIDTRTNKEIARHRTGAQTCPTHLARTDKLIWFSHGCEGTWNGGVGSIAFPEPPPAPGPSGSAATVRTNTSPHPTASPSPTPPPPVITLHVQGDVRFQRAPLLTARDNPAGPLVAGQPNLSLSTVYVYRVATGGALTTQASGTAPGSNLNDIGLDKYGETLLTGAGSRNATQAWATADLSGRGSYYTGYHPVAVAASPDGFHVANGVRANGDDVYVYETGGVVPERRLDLTGDVVAPRGITWSPDSQRLYVVTQPAAGGPPTLRVVSV
jgi:DNA-binding beta-propeller fold protein YncE